MKKKYKIVYEVDVLSCDSGKLIRTLTFESRQKAIEQVNFYNSTLNLKATMTETFKK